MSADVLAAPLITEPGVYPGIPFDTYNADPVTGGSLRSTAARLLIKQGGPARYKWMLDHPGDREVSDEMDLGTLAHWRVLGDPDDRIVLVEGDDWRGARGQARRDLRAEGKTAVLQKHLDRVDAMAAALVEHRTAGQLLRAARHEAPEQTVVWRDKTTGVMCRTRFDTFHQATNDQRLTIVDYKSTSDASNDGFGKSAANLGYHQQDDMYRAAAVANDMDDDPLFLFVAQETSPPFSVNVITLDATAKNIGRNLNRIALNIYAECTSTGHWPAYGQQINTASLPPWYERAHDEEGEAA